MRTSTPHYSRPIARGRVAARLDFLMPRRPFRIDPKLFEPDEFLRAVNSHDHMGIVLRSHAYIDAFLLDLIDSQLPSPELMEWASIRFEDKLNLAVALDLIDAADRPAYLKLNTMRNKLAHHPNATTTVGEVLELIDVLNPVQLWTFVEASGRLPLAGRDLQRLITVLFVGLATRVPLARRQGANPSGRPERYAALVRDAQRKLQRFRDEQRRRKAPSKAPSPRSSA